MMPAVDLPIPLVEIARISSNYQVRSSDHQKVRQSSCYFVAPGFDLPPLLMVSIFYAVSAFGLGPY